MTSPTHPCDSDLQALIGQSAESACEDQVIEHLGECAKCQERLDALAVGRSGGDSILRTLREESASVRSSAQTIELESLADFAVAFLEPTSHPGAIGRLGEFQVLSVIGQGGMGIVLKGFQEELNRPVAIKVMSPHLATLAVARKRFLREAQATAAIVHPNVMPILSVSESSSLPFLVMPFVACHSLQQRLDADGPLPVVDILRIAVQITHGLAAAHAQGLVHRDVKPANILLERSVDRAMLTDFGLARAADDVTVTRSGVIAGTPQYMSPEQARGEPIDERSDLFSLGSVLYAMATGRPPFRAESSYGILRKITDQEPRPMREQNAQVPVWLDRLTAQLLAKDSAQRPDHADQVAKTLEACLAHVQQPTVHALPHGLKRKRKPMKRFFLTVVCCAFVAMASLVVLSFVYWQVSRQPPQQDPISLSRDDLKPDQTDGSHAASVSIDQELRQLHEQVDRLIAEVDAQ